VRSTDGRAGQEVRVNSNQSDRSRLYSIAGGLDIIQWLRDVHHNRLRLGAVESEVQNAYSTYYRVRHLHGTGLGLNLGS
jgi:hypothetical protein